MSLIVSEDCSQVDWNEIESFLASVGMATYGAGKHQRAFEASFAKVFLYDGSKLVGFGRAISDGEYQAAMYDIAVSSEVQGKGIGKRVVQELLDRLPNCNVILYATPGMEAFYRKQGFGDMTTGMAIFKSEVAMNKFTKISS